MTIKFEPRDLWIGVYWTRTSSATTLETHTENYRVYLCLIPCFPIIFTIRRRIPWTKRHKYFR